MARIVEYEAVTMNQVDTFQILRLEGPHVPAELLTARNRAEALLEEAQLAAESLRAGARAEVEAACALERARLRTRHARLLGRRRRRLARADHLRRVRLCEAAAEACLAVAEQVWRQVPEDRGPLIRDLARELLRRAPAGPALELRAHPEDLPLLPRSLPGLADRSLSPGDLVARFEGGGLDARVEARAGLALDALAHDLGLLREASE